ncbi:hypothetical protein [Phenylobacterium ferrooxidans]|uniref:Uncharacterized protein n=1 Tax=Phenylobacterium ferrooxidans TaxID=2982689 RepID=A0ABW6CMN8_9CAUL
MSGALLRVWAASERASLANIENQFGPNLAHRAARRFVYEITAWVTETQGKPDALKMLFAAQDAIALDVLIDDRLPEIAPDEELAPTVTETLGGMTDALEHMADAVHAVAAPRTLGEAAYDLFERVTWWPLALVAGLIIGMAIQ